MLFLIFSWLLLITICFVMGAAILRVSGPSAFNRTGDHFIISGWLGIIILSNALLAISFFTGLSLIAFGFTCVCLLLMAGIAGKTFYLDKLKFFLLPRVLFPIALLLISVSFVSSQVVTWFDTGGYHFGSIKWLSRFGTVPGLALIYYGFGYTSSWFALAAPFNNWIFDARSASLTGGFVLLLIILHFSICLVRLITGRGMKSDWFVALALFFSLPVILRFEIYVSPSTDFPVIVLAIVVAWACLSILQHRDRVSHGQLNFGRQTDILPLILSAGAVTIKLSAVPILLFSIFFFLCTSKIPLKKVFLSVSLILVILGPFLAAQVMTSGLLFYPSSLISFDLPWTIGPEKSQEIISQIAKSAQWSTITPPRASSSDWILQWLIREKYQTFLILITLVSFLLTVTKPRQHFCHWVNWLLGLGLTGLIYTIILGPTWRYSLGYLSILPAVFLASFLSQRLTALRTNLSHSRVGISNKRVPSLIILIFALLIPAASYARNNFRPLNYLRMEIQQARKTGDLPYSKDWSRTILPPKIINFQLSVVDRETFAFKISRLEFTKHRVDGFDLYKPEQGFQCWDGPLPCSQFLTYTDIMLRDPDRGVRAGFVRAK